jgi:F-type H+-transporting ATPase subunit delta
MSASVARRYARAFFELARESGRVSEATAELRGFADAYAASEEFQAMELNPTLHDAERAAIVKAIGTRISASDLTVRVVGMLATRQRLSVLPELLRFVEEMADEHLGVVRATVLSARPLSESYKSKLKGRIESTTGRRAIINYEQDPSLIAGLVTQIGDRVIDGSIRGRLNQLADSLHRA